MQNRFTPSEQANRRAIRRYYRRVRRALAASVQHEHATAAAIALRRSRLWLHGATFAGYAAADGELDLQPAFAALRAGGKCVGLPVIPRLGKRLEFFEDDGRPLIAGRYGILVPPLNAAFLSLLRIDVLLMPLVAFDAHGTRLGMGGGYYDQTLAGLSPGLRPHLIGVAHACQEHAEALPREHWDIPLDGVLTEHGLRMFARDRSTIGV